MADEAEDLPEELVITLRKPVKLGEETYHELRLKEPTAAQVMEWDKLGGTEMDIKAVAIVSGLPEPAVRMIGIRDLTKAAKYISRFLG